MPDLKKEEVQRYLQSVFGASVTVSGMSILGDFHQSKDVKGYGYGVPLKVDFQLNGSNIALPCSTP